MGKFFLVLSAILVVLALCSFCAELARITKLF
jgi:hypothetical protein